MERALHTAERAARKMIMEHFEETALLHNRASRIVPSWPFPRSNMALALFFVGQVKRAIRVSEAALEDHPDDVHSLANSGRFHL